VDLYSAIPGLIFLTFLAKIVEWRVRRGSLGVVLWTSPTARRWPAIPVLILGIAVIAYGISHALGAWFILVGASLAAWSVAIYFPRRFVQVRQDGIEVGLLALPWTQITGWAWGPGLEEDEGSSLPIAVAALRLLAPIPKGKDLTLLSVEGQDRRTFCIWVSSPWKLFYEPRSATPIRTGVLFDDRLNQLLKQHENLLRPSSAAG